MEAQLELVCTSGRPFELMDVRVVDEAGADVPKDGATVGEVWVRGSTLFEGYWRQPGATAEAFAPGGWFRTGDLAQARPDGYLQVRSVCSIPAGTGCSSVPASQVPTVKFDI